MLKQKKWFEKQIDICLMKVKVCVSPNNPVKERLVTLFKLLKIYNS